MKILLTMKLGQSKVDSKIEPLTRVDCVDEIMVVRYRPGPELPKVRYYCPPSFVARLSGLATVHNFLNLIRLSLLRKPDLVFAYLLVPHGILAFIAAKLTGRAIGISLIAGRAELYEVFSRFGIDFRQPLPWFGRAYLKILSRCDIIVVPGSVTRDFLRSHGIDENRIHILHHPGAEAKYHPVDLRRKYDVISVGRLDKGKHFEILLEAVSAVEERHQDTRVVIVGDGPCRTDLERLSAQLGLSGKVEFAGFKENVAHYYNSSRIFVLTSEREGFPSVLVEAMMCGIPSVVSNCGDIIDIAEDGFNAIVVDNYNDVESFANAIIRLLQDNELRHRLSQNALETARHLSVAEVAHEWELILHKVARSRKSVL